MHTVMLNACRVRHGPCTSRPNRFALYRSRPPTVVTRATSEHIILYVTLSIINAAILCLKPFARLFVCSTSSSCGFLPTLSIPRRPSNPVSAQVRTYASKKKSGRKWKPPKMEPNPWRGSEQAKRAEQMLHLKYKYMDEESEKPDDPIPAGGSLNYRLDPFAADLEAELGESKAGQKKEKLKSRMYYDEKEGAHTIEVEREDDTPDLNADEKAPPNIDKETLEESWLLKRTSNLIFGHDVDNAVREILDRMKRDKEVEMKLDQIIKELEADVRAAGLDPDGVELDPEWFKDSPDLYKLAKSLKEAKIPKFDRKELWKYFNQLKRYFGKDWRKYLKPPPPLKRKKKSKQKASESETPKKVTEEDIELDALKSLVLTEQPTDLPPDDSLLHTRLSYIEEKIHDHKEQVVQEKKKKDGLEKPQKPGPNATLGDWKEYWRKLDEYEAEQRKRDSEICSTEAAHEFIESILNPKPKKRKKATTETADGETAQAEEKSEKKLKSERLKKAVMKRLKQNLEKLEEVQQGLKEKEGQGPAAVRSTAEVLKQRKLDDLAKLTYEAQAKMLKSQEKRKNPLFIDEDELPQIMATKTRDQVEPQLQVYFSTTGIFSDMHGTDPIFLNFHASPAAISAKTRGTYLFSTDLATWETNREWEQIARTRMVIQDMPGQVLDQEGPEIRSKITGGKVTEFNLKFSFPTVVARTNSRGNEEAVQATLDVMVDVHVDRKLIPRAVKLKLHVPPFKQITASTVLQHIVGDALEQKPEEETKEPMVFESGMAPTFDEALQDIQRQLPNMYMKNCWNCALSVYSPFQVAIFGSLACFRDKANEVIQAQLRNPVELINMWTKQTDTVQEVYFCPKFKRRTFARPPPLEVAKDFKIE